MFGARWRWRQVQAGLGGSFLRLPAALELPPPCPARPARPRYFSALNGANFYRQALGGGLLELFALSSDCNEPAGTGASSAQAAWLAAQLPTSTATWRFALLHHSPYSSSTSHGSITRMQWGFEGMALDAALSGHDHVRCLAAARCAAVSLCARTVP